MLPAHLKSRVLRLKSRIYRAGEFFVVSLWLFAAFGAVELKAQTTPEKPVAKSEAPLSVQKPDEKKPPESPYNLLRYDEDFSYLRDKSKRTDVFDPIKYVRLRRNRDDWYLSVGGEIRPYYVNARREGFGTAPRDTNGFLLQRLMLHTDFHFGKSVRVFAQIKSGLEFDRNGGPRPPDEDKLDANQLFVDFNFGVRRNDKNSQNENSPTENAPANQSSAETEGIYAEPKLVFRVGRQEFDFGAGRIVSVRDGPNVRQTFDGLRLIIRTGKWRFDALAVKPVADKSGFFDDNTIGEQTFWGVYATRPLPVFFSRKNNIDFYYFGTDRKNARFDQGTGRDIRHTFGFRFFNAKEAFDYDVELSGQLGKFGSGNIRAWSISTNTGYTFAARFKPRFGLATGFVSGDKDPNDPNLQTFAPPYPRGQYFGVIGANGPLNILGFRPTLNFKFPRQVQFQVGEFFFWRESLRDGLYSVPGGLLRTGQLSRARFIGTEPEVEATWQANRHLTFNATYSVFATGRFVRETPPGKNVYWFQTKATFKF